MTHEWIDLFQKLNRAMACDITEITIMNVMSSALFTDNAELLTPSVQNEEQRAAWNHNIWLSFFKKPLMALWNLQNNEFKKAHQLIRLLCSRHFS